MNIPKDLQVGDFIGYHHKGNLLAEATYLRTGGLFTHAAVYVGDGNIVTSLVNGVDIYPIDLTGIVGIRRQTSPAFDIEKAMIWFNLNAKGRPYGIMDTLKDAFPDLGDYSNGWNCSHTCAEFLRTGGLVCFSNDCDYKMITPRDFEITPVLSTIYLTSPN